MLLPVAFRTKHLSVNIFETPPSTLQEHCSRIFFRSERPINRLLGATPISGGPAEDAPTFTIDVCFQG
jgi:hypothetical protein